MVARRRDGARQTTDKLFCVTGGLVFEMRQILVVGNEINSLFFYNFVQANRGKLGLKASEKGKVTLRKASDKRSQTK